MWEEFLPHKWKVAGIRVEFHLEISRGYKHPKAVLIFVRSVLVLWAAILHRSSRRSASIWNLHPTERTRNRFNTATCHGQLPGVVGRPPMIRVKYDNREPLCEFVTPHFQVFTFFSGLKPSTVLGLSSNSSSTESGRSTCRLAPITSAIARNSLTVAVFLVAAANLAVDPFLTEATLDVTVSALSYNVATADAGFSAPSNRDKWRRIVCRCGSHKVFHANTCDVEWCTVSCTATTCSISRNILRGAPWYPYPYACHAWAPLPSVPVENVARSL